MRFGKSERALGDNYGLKVGSCTEHVAVLTYCVGLGQHASLSPVLQAAFFSQGFSESWTRQMSKSRLRGVSFSCRANLALKLTVEARGKHSSQLILWHHFSTFPPFLTDGFFVSLFV